MPTITPPKFMYKPQHVSCTEHQISFDGDYESIWFSSNSHVKVNPTHPLADHAREVYDYLEIASFIRPDSVYIFTGYRSKNIPSRSPLKKIRRPPMFRVSFVTTEKMFKGVVMEEVESVCSRQGLLLELQRVPLGDRKLTEYNLYFSKKRDCKGYKEAKKAKLRKRKRARKAKMKGRS